MECLHSGLVGFIEALALIAVVGALGLLLWCGIRLIQIGGVVVEVLERDSSQPPRAVEIPPNYFEVCATCDCAGEHCEAYEKQQEEQQQ